MASFSLIFNFFVSLLQCQILSVAPTSTNNVVVGFPNNDNIAKSYQHNKTIDEKSSVYKNEKKKNWKSKKQHTVSTNKLPVQIMKKNTTVTTKPNKSILLDESKRRIFCFGANQKSKVKNQRFYLPIRFLATLRKNLDYIILPGNHLPTREYVSFIIPLLGLSKDQIIWTSGNNMAIDCDIDTEILKELRLIISGEKKKKASKDNWILIPYCVNKDFHKWSVELTDEFPCERESDRDGKKDMSKPTLEVFGETEEWNLIYGHKGILHRHIADLSIPSVIEDIDQMVRNSEKNGHTNKEKGILSSVTAVPLGYQCSTNEHLIEAYRLLKGQTNDDRAVIKPITGSSGVGIIFIDTLEDLISYDFPMGEVLLEEMLNLDFTEDGLVISPAVHYLGTELFGGQLVDQLMKETTYLGWRESKADSSFQQKVLQITEKLLQYTQPKVRFF